MRLERQPRYVDMGRCTGCGDCAKVCPVVRPDEFNTGLGEWQAIYRLYPQAIPSAFGIKKLDRAPCVQACPANLSAQGYVQLIKARKFKEALDIIMDRLPLPGVIGRICPHPCESVCRRGEVDEPVAICSLKRLAADQADWATLPVPEAAKNGQAVAIVGAGPAGLACGYHLARMGYAPVIFEAAAEAGGWLRYGIPEYRLPRHVLEQEVAYIQRCGVEMRLNSPLGGDRTIDGLLTKEGFKAVFLGVGCQGSLKIPVPGAEAQGVFWGVDYLKEFASTGASPTQGKKVAVIGGGNVAMDVGQTALRNGAAAVQIICLESREEMPASPWEVAEAELAGCSIEHRWGVKEITAGAGAVTGVEVKAVERVFDAEGRFAPTYFEDQIRRVEADVVILAIGQKAELDFITAADGIRVNQRGLIEADPGTLQTSRPEVFAGGDVVSGPYIAIAAVAAGREAAISIDRYLRGQDLQEDREFPLRYDEQGEWNPIPQGTAKQPRAVMPHLPVEEWAQSFQEMAQGLSVAQGQAEAARCVNCGVCADCLQCVAACRAEAIAHHQKPEKLEVEVGAVVLAPGFQTFDPSEIHAYAYAHSPNVVTSLEFERILSAGGPFQGHVQRLSDGREPKKIAWIQCVGSRSEREGCHEYCSSVCCMYALKQALIAKDHVGPELDTAIFYMDMRTPRKDFEKYYERVKSQGARLIRSRVHTIDPLANGDLSIRYGTEAGEMVTETFDLVVLSVGLETGADMKELARELGVELSRNDFMETSCFTPVNTSRPGIFACGAFTGPKDIPQSVREGSAAAAAATMDLAEVRGTRQRERVYPQEKELGGAEARVGVFVCNCGINIGGIADVPAIAAYARTLPEVAYVQENLFSCSEDAQKQMIEVIKEHNLNRVVVAACSPSTHQPIFQDMLRNAGLNKYLFEMANIRNQCTWVHQSQPEVATQKCQDLVRMGVAKARLLTPLTYITMPVTKRALVIGGGVAGLAAALTLARHGFGVDLAERTDRLGGQALRLNRSWRGEAVAPFVEKLVKQVGEEKNVRVHFNAEVTEATGVMGNFSSRLSTGEEIKHGVVIMATGGLPYIPEGQYLYGENPNVLLTLDLDREIREGSARVSGAGAAAFIQCVGSRIPERPYCSRVCCTHSVDNALKLKEINPEMDVFVLYRDMRTYGERERLYLEAREKGVVFIRYRLDDPPRVKEENGRLQITVTDPVLQRPLELGVDILTLATAIVPYDNRPVAEIYKTALNAEGFFSEAHAKIRPVDSAAEGIFLAGLCHNPKPMEDSIRLGLAAASRSATILSKETLMLDAIISRPVDENCDGCAFCVDTCPYHAITLVEYMKDGVLKRTVEVNEALCKGCGSCMATCPKNGIYVAGFTLEQLQAQVDAALGEG